MSISSQCQNFAIAITITKKSPLFLKRVQIISYGTITAPLYLFLTAPHIFGFCGILSAVVVLIKRQLRKFPTRPSRLPRRPPLAVLLQHAALRRP